MFEQVKKIRIYTDEERARARAYYHNLPPDKKRLKLEHQKIYSRSDKGQIRHEKRKIKVSYREYQKQYRIDHPETPESLKRHFKNHIQRHYKMTVEEYDSLLLSQNNRCAICLGENKKNKFSIDHNHRCCKDKKSCGKCNRGLLCIKCNLMLGAARDSILILKSSIEYLEKWTL